MVSPSERKRLARIAAYAMHAKHDPVETTRAARQAFRDRFLDQVDPTGELRRDRPEEAARRAEAKRSEFYARLSHAAANARAKKKGAKARTNKNAEGAQPAAFQEDGSSHAGLHP